MSKDMFQKELSMLHQSGVGVVAVRTKEPFRADDALREWADSREMPYHIWDVANGWRTWQVSAAGGNPPSSAKPEITEHGTALAAIKATPVLDLGLRVMMWMAPMMVQSQKVQHLLCEYIRVFAEDPKKRLVLLLPDTFIIPPALQHDLCVLDFGLPDREELTERLETSIASAAERTKLSDADKEVLVSSSAGLTALEAEVAFCRSIMENIEAWNKGKATVDMLNSIVLKTKTEVIKRSDVLELMPPVPLSEVGGLDLAKEYIQNRRAYFTEEAKADGVDVPKGIALIGPPRTGKSLFAKMVASVFEMPLVKFDIGRVFGSMVGESEGKIRGALTMLDALEPCVVLFDEADKAGIDPRQAGGDSGVSKRIIGSLLTYMQECRKKVYFIFTLNRVDNVPPELLGKGRLDDVFAVMAPNVEERRQILGIHLIKRKRDPKKVRNLEAAVVASDGYVGAEIESAVKESVMESFRTKKPVTGEMIVGHLKTTKPASEKFKEDYQQMVSWAEDNARPSSTKEAKKGGYGIAAPRSRKLGGPGAN